MPDARLALGLDGADLVLDGDGLEIDDGLVTPVLVSVLSDARDENPVAPTLDAEVRGYWADNVRDRFGSRLWQLEREKRTLETLERARELGRDALAWLVEERIAATVDVDASYDVNGRLLLDATITRGSSNRHAELWAGTSAVRVHVAQPVTPAPAPEPPPDDLNFLWFYWDDVGAEYFNWSGLLEPDAGFALTPQMERLRRLGVTFLQARSTGICGPTRACGHTMRQGFRQGLAQNLDGEDADGFQLGVYAGVETEVMLARALRLGRDGTDDQSLGLNNFTYLSAWFGKGHIFSDAGYEAFPVSHAGFGLYAGCPPNSASLENWPFGQIEPNEPSDPGYVPQAANSGHFHFRKVVARSGAATTVETIGSVGSWPTGGPYEAWNTTTTPRAAWDAFDVFRDALGWINTRTKPFLAVVCMNPPHSPFEVPPFEIPDNLGFGATNTTIPLISAATRATMESLNSGAGAPGFRPTNAARIREVGRANCEAVDTLIGLMYDRMEPTRRAKTVIILQGDNGTVGQLVSTPYDPGHAKRTLFETGVRVPMFVLGPPEVVGTPDRTCDHLVHTVDIGRTILELAQCDPERWNPGGLRKIDGRSFAGVLRDPAAPAARDFVYNEIFAPIGGQLDGSESGAPPIDTAQWVRSITHDGWKLIVRTPGSVPPYWLFRVGSELQPGSGQPGYLELIPADDLYPKAIDGLHPDVTARFEDLLARMTALLES